MKILFPVSNNDALRSNLDDRFPRANFFLIYDSFGQTIVSLENNPYKGLQSGVGFKVGAYVVENGCRICVGLKPGSKLSEVLQQAHIRVIPEESGTVLDCKKKNEADFVEQKAVK